MQSLYAFINDIPLFFHDELIVVDFSLCLLVLIPVYDINQTLAFDDIFFSRSPNLHG